VKKQRVIGHSPLSRRMLRLYIDTAPEDFNRSRRPFRYAITVLSILLGASCLAAIIFTALHWDLNSNIVKQCKNDTQPAFLCYVRSIFTNALQTEWDKYFLVTFLFTYATVFLHIVSGLLGLTSIQTILLIIGIGVSYPILFVSSFIYFYRSTPKKKKSPVPINLLALALIYVILMIVVPTYLLYFFLTSSPLVVSIASIVLLVSPIGFALISFPCGFCSQSLQRCWMFNSHRFLAGCQIGIFILCTPLYFISLVSLIYHWSFDRIRESYVKNSSDVNPMTIIWTIDYVSLLISVMFFITTNEYLLLSNVYRTRASKMKLIISWLAFAILFLVAPCLAFPIYIAWREYQYLEPN
jgi:hypothetical protein